MAVEFIKCKVIGTGIDSDSFRPSIVDKLDRDEAWTAVYYPKNPPFQYCIVRLRTGKEVKERLRLDKEEKVLDSASFKAECDSNPYFKYRWKTQPAYKREVKWQK